MITTVFPFMCTAQVFRTCDIAVVLLYKLIYQILVFHFSVLGTMIFPVFHALSNAMFLSPQVLLQQCRQQHFSILDIIYLCPIVNKNPYCLPVRLTAGYG